MASVLDGLLKFNPAERFQDAAGVIQFIRMHAPQVCQPTYQPAANCAALCASPVCAGCRFGTSTTQLPGVHQALKASALKWHLKLTLGNSNNNNNIPTGNNPKGPALATISQAMMLCAGNNQAGRCNQLAGPALATISQALMLCSMQ